MATPLNQLELCGSLHTASQIWKSVSYCKLITKC